MRTPENNDEALILALRRMKVETGSLICLGCCYEHSCSTHGCAIINAAIIRIQNLLKSQPDSSSILGGTYVSVEWFDQIKAERNAAVARLKALATQEPNEPLTLEQLRKMDGDPVWVKELVGGVRECNWVLMTSTKHDGLRAMALNTHYLERNYGVNWLAYRHKLDGDSSNG